MFLTIAYAGGWIHSATYGNHSSAAAQYYDANGVYHTRTCKSDHAARCFLTRQSKKA